MKVVYGDLIDMALEGHFDVIVHGCNCFCAMGAGIAKQIKETFRSAYNEDLKTNEWSKPARIQVAEENIQAISDFLRFQ